MVAVNILVAFEEAARQLYGNKLVDPGILNQLNVKLEEAVELYQQLEDAPDE
jgi:hypothetical protein